MRLVFVVPFSFCHVAGGLFEVAVCLKIVWMLYKDIESRRLMWSYIYCERVNGEEFREQVAVFDMFLVNTRLR